MFSIIKTATLVAMLANQQQLPHKDLSKIPFYDQSSCSTLNHLNRYPEDRSFITPYRVDLQYAEIMDQLDCHDYLEKQKQEYLASDEHKQLLESIERADQKRLAEAAKFEPEYKARQCADYLYFRDTDTENNGHNFLSQWHINSFSSPDAYQKHMERCKWLSKQI